MDENKKKFLIGTLVVVGVVAAVFSFMNSGIAGGEEKPIVVGTLPQAAKEGSDAAKAQPVPTAPDGGPAKVEGVDPADMEGK
jgi:hypothetical protein